NGDFRIGEASVLMREDNVAGRGEPGTAGVGASLDERDDWFFHATDRVKDVGKRFGIFDMPVSGSIEHFLERSEIRAGAKIRALAFDSDDACRRLAQSEEGFRQLIGNDPVERV